MSAAAATLHAVVPAGLDDPTRPSGGNRYDRRVLDELSARGWTVHEHLVGNLGQALAGIPDNAVVIVDGLLGVADPSPVVRASVRLRTVVLLHMPFAEAAAQESVRRAERTLLHAAAAVVTTSEWAGSWVVRHHGLPPERVHVAVPGVDLPASRHETTGADGRRLLCLAAVTAGKGHDVLLAALAHLDDLDWSCTCVGSLEVEPAFAARLQRASGDRIQFTGALAGEALEDALANADLLVSASRHEAYGIGVTEALARGVPAIVTDVGGHAEAVGHVDMLVPVDDPDTLAKELRRWLTDPTARESLRTAAAQRRATLPSWSDTARALEGALR
jgi:glycosyltransferase involved in cell wall biosynthesis